MPLVATLRRQLQLQDDMALEDTVAAYEIQITRTGDGATVAAQELNNLAAAGKSAAASANEASSALNTLHQSGLLGRDSLHVLNLAALAGGGEHFPMLREAIMGVHGAVNILTRGAEALGISLGTTVTGLGVVGGAIAFGVAAWHEYTDSLKAAQEQIKETAKAMEEMPALVEKISALQAAGLISGSQANTMFQTFGRGTPAAEPFDPTLIYKQGGGSAFPSSGRLVSTVGLGGTINKDSLGGVQKSLQDMGLTGPEIEATEKLIALREKLNIETETGFAKQIDEENKRYSDELSHIQTLETIAGQKFSDREGMQRAAENAHQARLTEIAQKDIEQDAKAEEEKLRFEAEAERQAQEQKLKDYREYLAERNTETEAMIKQFNQQEKLYALQSKDNKRDVLAQELADKKDFDMAMYLDHRITLDKMTEMDNEAQIQYLQGLQHVETADKLHIMTMEQMESRAAVEFANGFASAFTSFIEGTKSAGEAFSQFALQFLSQIGQMILAQEVLIGLKGLGILGGGGVAVAQAGGGITFAAGGLAGVSSVSSATYFPKFNVVAGEAGHEMLTVLAAPKMMDLGGIQAAVGRAGSQTLAITNAQQLANRVGGGPGGHMVLEVSMESGLKAELVSSSVQQAELRVTQQLQRTSPLRDAVKQAVV